MFRLFGQHFNFRNPQPSLPSKRRCARNERGRRIDRTGLVRSSDQYVTLTDDAGKADLITGVAAEGRGPVRSGGRKGKRAAPSAAADQEPDEGGG